MPAAGRMFVAIPVPGAAAENLEEFLAPRQEAGPDLRWTVPEQWHVTLAFLPAVPDRALDGLAERLGRSARRRTPGEVRLAGGGAFPHPADARVLYAALDADPATLEEVERLATGARSAAVASGVEVAGGRFHPHVTVARSGRPIEATRWLRVLESYAGPRWPVTEVALVASHLGEGPRRRPRYEVLDTFPVARPVDGATRG